MSAAERVTLHHGDCLDVLRTLADCSVDSVVTDPPYHLTSIVKRFGGGGAAPAQFGKDGAFARASKGFMGKEWDGGDIAFRPETWAEVLRVLKPGGYLLAFASTRGFCRMGCAIQDAGFIEHPFIAWLFGTGFPKSTRIKAEGFDGWRYGGQALKPAIEQVFVGQKPFSEATGTANILRWGTGAVNIDGCRIPSADQWPSLGELSGGDSVDCYGDGLNNSGRSESSPLGRWPANVIHDGSDEVLDAFAAYGSNRGAAAPVRGTESSAAVKNTYGDRERVTGCFHNDSGSASRFFYSAKADASDRLGSGHPTVKPVDLMAYLCRLVTPPGGVVLDPFAGSGTTGMACLREGFRAVLIEREAEYVADIRRRLAHVSGADMPLFGGDGTELAGGGERSTGGSRPTNRGNGIEEVIAP